LEQLHVESLERWTLRSWRRIPIFLEQSHVSLGAIYSWRDLLGAEENTAFDARRGRV
jgi:hypothetical protein